MSVRFVPLAALLFAGPAAGAPAKEFSVKQTREIMHDYAECVVKRRPAKASEAILTYASNRTILRDYRMLVISDCLKSGFGTTTTMKLGGDLYRFALADALVSREFAGQPAPDLSGVAPLAHPATPEEPGKVDKSGKKLSEKAYAEAMKEFGEEVASTFLSQYGECVVRAEPALSRSLALSAPNSAAEKAEFDALRPTLAACLPKGRTLKFGMTTLRGTIAINYYRLAHAARERVTETAE